MVISETYHLRKQLKKARKIEREREIVAVLLTHTLLASTESQHNARQREANNKKKQERHKPVLCDTTEVSRNTHRFYLFEEEEGIEGERGKKSFHLDLNQTFHFSESF